MNSFSEDLVSWPDLKLLEFRDANRSAKIRPKHPKRLLAKIMARQATILI